MSVRYRLWQVWKLLTAAPLPAEAWQEIEAVLSPQELRLFQRYRPNDRRHAWRVMCTLQEAQRAHPALLAAALLHDVGKTRTQVHLWERSLAVLGARLFPRQAERWGEGTPHGWRRPFVVKAQHAAWGAEMAANAGSDPLTVWLIEHHQDVLAPLKASEEVGTEAERLLRQLQWADDHN